MEVFFILAYLLVHFDIIQFGMNLKHTKTTHYTMTFMMFTSTTYYSKMTPFKFTKYQLYFLQYLYCANIWHIKNKLTYK